MRLKGPDLKSGRPEFDAQLCLLAGKALPRMPQFP